MQSRKNGNSHNRSFKFSQALKFYSITNVRLKNIVHTTHSTANDIWYDFYQ